MTNGSPRAAAGADVIAQSLARVLGDEAAQTAVREAIRQLGLSGRPFGPREQAQTFELLAQRPGLIGVAARRAHSSFTLLGVSEPERAVQAAPPRATRAVTGDAIQGCELVGMFASALGDEKAREMIEAECKRLSLDFERVPTSGARALLDELAKTAGIVGIAARFAKARLALR